MMRMVNIKALCRALWQRKQAVRELEGRLRALGLELESGGLIERALSYDIVFEQIAIPCNLPPEVTDRIVDDWTTGADFEAWWMKYGNCMVARDG